LQQQQQRGRSIQSHHNDDDDSTTNHLLSARKARIIVPFVSSLSLIFGGVHRANAGIGAVTPFDAARKEKYPGSLSTSVILLRVSGALRRRAYFPNKSVVATVLPSNNNNNNESSNNKNELGTFLSRQFGDGITVVPLSTTNKSSSYEEYVTNIVKTGGNTRPSSLPFSAPTDISQNRAIILFGSEVDIASDGVISNIQTPNTTIKAMETQLLEKLAGIVPKDGNVLKEITIVGGVVIHREKTGVDRGDDYFQPLVIKTYIAENGRVVDLYEKTFGDLLTPRGDVSN